jgi:hypothetical protein
MAAHCRESPSLEVSYDMDQISAPVAPQKAEFKLKFASKSKGR